MFISEFSVITTNSQEVSFRLTHTHPFILLKQLQVASLCVGRVCELFLFYN